MHLAVIGFVGNPRTGLLLLQSLCLKICSEAESCDAGSLAQMLPIRVLLLLLGCQTCSKMPSCPRHRQEHSAYSTELQSRTHAIIYQILLMGKQKDSAQTPGCMGQGGLTGGPKGPCPGAEGGPPIGNGCMCGPGPTE